MELSIFFSNYPLQDYVFLFQNVMRKKEDPDNPEYEAPEVDAQGNVVQRTLLTKYDEEIQGIKMKSFRLGTGGLTTVEEDVPEAVRRMAKLRHLQNLDMPQAQLAQEYFTQNEMVSFRKVKKTKKTKKKKKLNVDDLEPMEEEESLVHLGSRHARQARIDALQIQDEDEAATGEVAVRMGGGRTLTLKDLLEEQDQVKEEEMPDADDVPEVEQDDIELQEALARSRRAKLTQSIQPSSERILDVVKERNAANPAEEEEEEMVVDGEELLMTLNTTDEFCRTLGDLPTYGLSGNRAEEDQSMLQLQPPKVQCVACVTVFSALCGGKEPLSKDKDKETSSTIVLSVAYFSPTGEGDTGAPRSLGGGGDR